MTDVKLPSLANVPFVEGLYKDFQRDPASIPEEWRAYFQVMENGDSNGAAPTLRSSRGAGDILIDRTRSEVRAIGAQDRVDQLIRVYRMRGHIIAQIDPLGFNRPTPPEL